MQVENGERLWTNVDPAIKLFGKDIPFTSIFTPLNGKPYAQQDGQSEAMLLEEKDKCMNEGCEEGNVTCTQGVLSCMQEASIAPSPCAEIINTEKKSEKSVPCPRCESMDTKFCYFNNYNANQPRHFCRKCQRYWTAGGLLRNVPFGAGRRKHKQSSSHPRHGQVSETLKARHLQHPLATQTSTKNNQQMRQQVSILNNCEMDDLINPFTKNCESTFGQEIPFCQNVAARVLSVHHCAAMPNGQSLKSCQTNVEDEPEDTSSKEHFQSSDISIADDNHDVASVAAPIDVGSSASKSPTATLLVEFSQQGEEEDSLSSCTHGKQGEEIGSTSKACKKSASMGKGCELEGAQAACSPNLWHCAGAAPGAMSASLPWPFMYPPAMWGPLYSWAGSWAALQWGQAAAVMMQHSGIGSGVRKHHLESGQSDGNLRFPKTLRIDNPADAARSSIWTTLGLTDRPPSSLFDDVNIESKKANSETPIRHSNPAAFSRSVAFNES